MCLYISDTRKVFISFSRRKKFSDSPDAYKVAKDLYARLEREGCKPWMDEEGIEYGEGLAEGIFTALKECDVIIPVITRGYAMSLWCLRELYYTILQKPRKKVIPLLLEDEKEIKHERAGSWLIDRGTERKYFKLKEIDAVIDLLKKMVWI